MDKQHRGDVVIRPSSKGVHLSFASRCLFYIENNVPGAMTHKKEQQKLIYIATKPSRILDHRRDVGEGVELLEVTNTQGESW